MLKPERKAQWCGHDGASEFGPPGLSAAVHVWGSDPVPPYQLGLSSRMPLWGSNPGLPDQLWACYSHVRAPCREDRLGGLWSRSGSGHKLDRSTGAPRAPRQPAPGAIESGCWPLVVPLVNSFYTSPGSVSASGPHIGPHRIGGAAAARLPVIHPETAPSPPLRRRPRRMAQRAQARRDVNDPASSGHLWPRTATAGVSPAWVIGSFLFFLPSRYAHAAPWRRRSPRVCCVKDHVDDAQRPQPRSPTLPPWVGWLGEKASPGGKHPPAT